MTSIASGPLTPGSFAAEGSALAKAMASGLVHVETVLDGAVEQAYALANETSHHLLRAGGKRVRPMLVLLTSRLGEGESDRVYKAAAAVELIHLASLYHDDVMDDAPVRRGAVAAHEKWGNSVAILTGDLLFARASLLSTELGAHAVELQSKTFERLVLGQLQEFVGPQEGEDPTQHYLKVLSDKTGSLIAHAGEFGLLAANAPAEYFPVLREYGEAVGIAFQLADDIIDLTSDGSRTGKTPGTDLREGVPTLPTLYVRAEAAKGDKSAQKVVELLDRNLGTDTALEEARVALAAHPATQKARAEARKWAHTATKALHALPQSEVRSGLEAFAASVVQRVA